MSMYGEMWFLWTYDGRPDRSHFLSLYGVRAVRP